MLLKSVKLWNFRIFGTDGSFNINKPNLSLDFNDGINVLIGENDSGKSAIIDAIKMVLKTHSAEWIKIEDEDFFYDFSAKWSFELKSKPGNGCMLRVILP